MEHADTFAGLAKAVSDAGVGLEILIWLESMIVCDISAAVEALETGQLPPEQSACVRAMLIFALGPDQVLCVAPKKQSCRLLKFGGASCLSQGRLLQGR